MANVLPWLLLIFAIIIPVVSLTEWLVGRDGAKAAKERLTDWYVSVADHDWDRIISSSAKVTDGFVARVLGTRLMSTSAFARWSVIVGPLSLAVVFLSGFLHSGISIFNLSLIVWANIVVDFLFLVSSRFILRRLAASSAWQLSAFSIMYALVAIYLAVKLVYMIPYMVDFALLEILGERPVFNLFALLSDTKNQIWMLMAAPAVLSSLLFLAVTSTAFCLFVTRSFTKDAVLLVIERIAESPKGIFSTAATVIASITAVATAMDHLLSHK